MNLLVSLKHLFDSRSALFLLAISTFSAVASAQLDIRVADPASLISAQPGQIKYLAHIGHCSDLVSVQVGVEGATQSVDLEDLVALPEQGDTCLAYFPNGMSVGDSPSVQVRRRDDTQASLTEQFQRDNNLPSIEFGQAAIVGEPGSQRLAVTVSADDDTDITHLSFDVVGLRASDLTTTGGVIFEAKQRAFASTDVSARVYPDTEGQNQYTLSLPITGQLTNEEIAFDVVVLVDVSVVDASGNQRALSKVAFTGDSIQEAAQSLVLQTQEINIGDRLQRPVIVPSVDFQFRGLVALPGAGNGVSYQSSHPHLIAVTAAGTLYALEETGAEDVFITVTYPGLPSAQVRVIADFTRELAGLEFDGVTGADLFTLERLNSYISLPDLQVVFDDGSRSPLSGVWKPIIQVASADSAYLSTNNQYQLKASVTIDAAAPATIQAYVPNVPELTASLKIHY